jgi:hypothetical protein
LRLYTKGHVRVHQSAAPPFSLGLPSGLSRSQQLYMMQRFLNIPATPSYVKDDGGLILDRVVWRCRLTVSKPGLKAPMVSTLETIIW